MILTINHAKGAVHDFKLFKATVKPKHILPQWVLLADSGYQGIERIHNKSFTSKKKPHKQARPAADKVFNQQLFKLRIVIEHINAKFKNFKIMSATYRNRRHCYGLRSSLICGLINYENNSKIA